MYLTNKYTTWYNKIISCAQQRDVPDCYTEKHHIIPRSLGGDRSESNIVTLTAREHFVCHLLLTKMVSGAAQFKMIKALTMIMGVKNIGKGRYIANSRWYKYARETNRHNIDAFWTAERRLHHSNTLKEYNLNLDPTSPKEIERRRKLSDFQKTKEWSETAIASRSANMKRAADNRRGNPWTENRRLAYEANPPIQSIDSNNKRSISLKGRKTSTGNLGHVQTADTQLKKLISNPVTIAAWFLSPENTEVLCIGINKFSKENMLNVGMIRTMIDNPDKKYKGWKFLRRATGNERGTQNY